MRPKTVVAVCLVVAAVTSLLAACSVAGLGDARTGSIRWHGCDGIQCATLSVPLDPARPSGSRIELALARLPATGSRQGFLLTNPGGPGGSGVDLVRGARDIFSSELRRHYDIISWDPRGVGASTAVECDPDLDGFVSADHSPDDAQEVRHDVATAQALAAGCARRSGDLLDHVSTLDTVHDMDAIRAALGEAKVTYLGFSYGTYLGAMYAQQYPTRIRAMVLDGAVDPSLSYAQGAQTQAVGFEQNLDAFLDHCRHDKHCGFATGGDPRRAFDDVMAGIDAEPLPAKVDGEHRTLGPGEADFGVAQALYSGRDGWPDLAHALAKAAQGDGSELLELSDEYTGYQRGGTYSNEMGAFYATACVDTPAPRTATAVEQLADAAARVAPTFGPSNFWLGLPCTYWHAPATGVVAPVHAPGAPPIVVLGTTNDPATPLSGARALASQLPDARLVIYVSEGHTAYGRGSSCVDDAVDNYLVKLTLPTNGTRCH